MHRTRNDYLQQQCMIERERSSTCYCLFALNTHRGYQRECPLRREHPECKLYQYSSYRLHCPSNDILNINEMYWYWDPISNAGILQRPRQKLLIPKEIGPIPKHVGVSVKKDQLGLKMKYDQISKLQTQICKCQNLDGDDVSNDVSTKL